MLTKRDGIVALLAACTTLAVVIAMHAAQPVLGQTVFQWDKLVPQANSTGSVRFVTKGPTTTLNELEMHVTTLNPGQSPHPPHKHPNEELILLDTGTVETLQNGTWIKLEPGSVIFNASNVLHGLRNIGAVPAQYHVISWRTDKTPRD